ncbi:MAG: aspartate kinase [Methanobrevibacter sp.]|nr:aspartate kinase [Methanobrevibacter sp.]MBQ6628876.1 aspartate kinase [Methanobrevibacter sp.]
MDLIVAKFDGNALKDGSKIRDAAKSVVKEYMKGTKVVVIASATSNTTDELIKLSDEAVGSFLTASQKAEIMAMGERTSARLLKSAIEAEGVKAEVIDPYSDLWPIITDSNFLEAKIDLEESEHKINTLKILLNQGIVPVICGFLGKGKNDEVTTLGRGGSDITAFIIADCLDADEIIIISDVDGIMSSDPTQIEKAKLLKEISVEELRNLSTKGVRLIHPHALKYKTPELKAKVINCSHNDLEAAGTEIIGPFEEDLIKTASLYPDPLSIIAIVGDLLLSKAGLLSELTNYMAENNLNIYKLTVGDNSITVFVDKTDSQRAYHTLHDFVLKSEAFNSLSLGKDVALITIVNLDIVEKPGIIAAITEQLRKNSMKIIEINSSQTAIVLIVDWKDGAKACELINAILE